MIYNGWACAGGTSCWEPTTFPAGSCVNGSSCVYTEPVLSWDNSLKAMLITIKIASLDDWPADQENVQDGLAHVTWCFFWTLTILGSLYAINLVLAVQSDEFSKLAARDREERPKRRVRRKHDDSLVGKWLHKIEKWRLGTYPRVAGAGKRANPSGRQENRQCSG